jgi:hypothetical protein
MGQPLSRWSGNVWASPQQTEFHGYQTGAGVSHEHGFGPNDVQKINDYINGHYDPNYLNCDYFPNNANFPQ